MRKIIIQILKGELIIEEGSYKLPDLATIRPLREELKISQSELSRITGIPQASISRWELGNSDPLYSHAKRIFGTLQALKNHVESNNPEFKQSAPSLEEGPEQQKTQV